MSKERLVELMSTIPCDNKKCGYECNGKCVGDFDWSCQKKALAEHLLANGVVVPPLKIGQELWDIHYNKPRKWEVVYLGYNGKEWHINIHWWKDRHNFKTLSITYSFVGKMWYLTREEAEKKLKEGESNG